jgi:hypothetical protein
MLPALAYIYIEREIIDYGYMPKATVVKEIAIYEWAWRDGYGVDWKGKQKLIGYENSWPVLPGIIKIQVRGMTTSLIRTCHSLSKAKLASKQNKKKRYNMEFYGPLSSIS